MGNLINYKIVKNIGGEPTKFDLELALNDKIWAKSGDSFITLIKDYIVICTFNGGLLEVTTINHTSKEAHDMEENIKEFIDIFEKDRKDNKLVCLPKDPYYYIIKNIENSSLSKVKSKKESLCYVAKLLLDNNFEPEFVAGVLGNIMEEGDYGHFESNNYKKSAPPPYFIYINNYLYKIKKLDYSKEFSGKNILTVGLYKTCKLIDFTEETRNSSGGYNGQFGIGAPQFTGERCTRMVKMYLEICGLPKLEHALTNNNKYPWNNRFENYFKKYNLSDNILTKEKLIKAEGNLILEELKNNEKKVYDLWKSENRGKSNSVQMAGEKVCQYYERCKDDKSKGYPERKERGKNAIDIYKEMMKGN